MLVGVPFAPDDEHERWRVFRAAMDARCEPDLVLAAVREEGDAAVARAVVVEALPGVPDDRMSEWADADPRPSDGFVARRVAEIRTLRELIGGHAPGAAEIDGWSDWLQRSVAEDVGNAEVLALLADTGRTKRVRATARARLAVQSGVPSGSRLEVMYTTRNGQMLAKALSDPPGGVGARAATRTEVEELSRIWGPRYSLVSQRDRLAVVGWDVGIRWALGRFASASNVVVLVHNLPDGIGRGDAMAVIPVSDAPTVMRWLMTRQGEAHLRSLPGEDASWVVLDVEDEATLGESPRGLDPSKGCTGRAYVPGVEARH